jgi:UDP-glucose 4-epimerase
MASVDIITGGAGFIGVNLAARLIARGRRPVLLDNLSGGRLEFLDALGIREQVGFFKLDMADRDAVAEAFASARVEGEIGAVWHLCANSDIAAGVADPAVDLNNTFLPTYVVLSVMAEAGLDVLHFASTSAVYGDHGDVALSEDVPTRPISNYGAMKLASEAAISAACESFLTRASVLRFPNVVGTPATHGVIYDFVRKLAATPERLEVLGDGTQQKPYLHVDELIDAILFVADRADPGLEIVNIGPPDAGASVRFIAEAVRDHVSPGAEIVYGAEPRGWLGDVPKFHYATDKLARLGFGAVAGSEAAVARAISEIAAQLADA